MLWKKKKGKANTRRYLERAALGGKKATRKNGNESAENGWGDGFRLPEGVGVPKKANKPFGFKRLKKRKGKFLPGERLTPPNPAERKFPERGVSERQKNLKDIREERSAGRRGVQGELRS